MDSQRNKESNQPSPSASSSSPTPTLVSGDLETGYKEKQPVHQNSKLAVLDTNKEFGSISDPRVRLTLKWDNVRYSIATEKKDRKQILNGVSGCIRPGEVVAILGSSGAGKTTLLNILAGRVASGTISGHIMANGKKRSASWKRSIGYVEQNDAMRPTLTPRETLKYAALLRLPSQLSHRYKMDRISEIISDLGLTYCADTVIGDDETRGISGGERKRVSIGIELITNPRLLFLDEPTSGLDAFTAFTLIESLTRLASEQRKTVLMTIHQPREAILFLCSKIILMSQGKVMFFGTMHEAMSHFSSLGYPCPEYMNPGDFFLDTITVDVRSESAHVNSQMRLNKLIDAWETFQQKEGSRVQEFLIPPDVESAAAVHEQGQQQQHEEGKEAENAPKDELLDSKQAELVYAATSIKQTRFSHTQSGNSWWTEAWILLQQEIQNYRRKRVALFAVVFQTLIIFLVISFTFFQLPLNQNGEQSRVGVLFFVVVNTFFAVAQPLIITIPVERGIILRERYASTYHISAFYVSKFASVLPLRILCSSIYGLSLYYIVGLNPLASRYFIFLGILLDVLFVATAFGLFIGAAIPDLGLSQIMGPVIILVFFIYGGNIANSNTIPPVISWLQYLSPIKYGYQALFQNEFNGLSFTCNNGQPVLSSNGSINCTPGFSNGSQVIQQYGLGNISITACCFILLGFGFFFLFAGYIALLISLKPRMVLNVLEEDPYASPGTLDDPPSPQPMQSSSPNMTSSDPTPNSNAS